MRILLDTQLLIWALAEPGRLGDEARAAIEHGADDVLFSAASILEIAIKRRLGRVDFHYAPRAIAQSAVDAGYVELALDANAAALVADLPLLHRDPFDRVLVAQAIAEPAFLYTADPRLPPYSQLVRRIE
jgi:PIN domain nuclease of toxin-antitoxin system